MELIIMQKTGEIITTILKSSTTNNGMNRINRRMMEIILQHDTKENVIKNARHYGYGSVIKFLEDPSYRYPDYKIGTFSDCTTKIIIKSIHIH